MRMNRIAALLASLGLWLAPDLGALAQEAALPTPKSGHLPRRHHPRRHARGPAGRNGHGGGSVRRNARRSWSARWRAEPCCPAPRFRSPGSTIRASSPTAPKSSSFTRSSGLTIVTTGAALQDGEAGEVISVRNSDSGVTVSGAVQPDGTVRVSGG